ncbi:MAG: ferredoxin [bacterium]
MANLLLSALVVFLLLGGPLTLYAVIVILNNVWGGLKVKFLTTPENPLSLLVSWDNESYEIKVTRIKLDFIELVPGGRALSHSFTFEDSSAKNKSFVLALKLSEDEIKILTDAGLSTHPRALKQSTISVEVETLNGETRRFKIPKAKFIKSLSDTIEIDSETEIVTDKNPDSWSVQTRVFPWKKVEEEVEAPKSAVKAAGGAPAPRAPVDFAVTKVWIEPGCIVCDACEAEAPLVFWVKDDTCIVRENAPLDDAAAIKAAAEGCPVDVIKFTKVPKAAATSPA